MNRVTPETVVKSIGDVRLGVLGPEFFAAANSAAKLAGVESAVFSAAVLWLAGDHPARMNAILGQVGHARWVLT